MIEVLHWGDRTSEASAVDLTQIPDDGWVWVDVYDEDMEETQAVASQLGVDTSLADHILSHSNVPLLEEHADTLLVVLSGFISGQGTRLSTSDIHVIAGTNYLLSVHQSDLPGIKWAREKLRDGGQLTLQTPTGLLSHLALVGGYRYLPLLAELESQIDQLEELALAANPKTIPEAHALRRDIITLRRALRPQHQVFEDLSESDHSLFHAADRRMFRRVARNQANTLESLDAATSLLASVLETHRGATADQTNEIVRVLTVFSAVMLPLGLIAGVFGMNFVEIPWTKESWGFWILLGVMGLIAVSLWIYFARREFVGAPRLRELPKSVGLGLVQIGVTPIRVLASGVESTIRYVGGPGGESDQPD